MNFACKKLTFFIVSAFMLTQSAKPQIVRTVVMQHPESGRTVTLRGDRHHSIHTEAVETQVAYLKNHFDTHPETFFTVESSEDKGVVGFILSDDDEVGHARKDAEDHIRQQARQEDFRQRLADEKQLLEQTFEMLCPSCQQTSLYAYPMQFLKTQSNIAETTSGEVLLRRIGKHMEHAPNALLADQTRNTLEKIMYTYNSLILHSLLPEDTFLYQASCISDLTQLIQNSCSEYEWTEIRGIEELSSNLFSDLPDGVPSEVLERWNQIPVKHREILHAKMKKALGKYCELLQLGKNALEAVKQKAHEIDGREYPFVSKKIIEQFRNAFHENQCDVGEQCDVDMMNDDIKSPAVRAHISRIGRGAYDKEVEIIGEEFITYIQTLYADIFHFRIYIGRVNDSERLSITYGIDETIEYIINEQHYSVETTPMDLTALALMVLHPMYTSFEYIAGFAHTYVIQHELEKLGYEIISDTGITDDPMAALGFDM